VKEVIEHLKNMYKAALDSEFHAESMIVLGIEELLDVCYTMPEEDFNIRHLFLLLLKRTLKNTTYKGHMQVCLTILVKFSKVIKFYLRRF
jgi:hypothetical protein